MGIYLLWLVPATVGAALNWPWWLTYGLLVPGTIWYFGTEGLRYYEQAGRIDSKASLASRVPAIGVLCWVIVVTLFANPVLGTARCCGLLVVAGLIAQALVFYRGPVKRRRGLQGL